MCQLKIVKTLNITSIDSIEFDAKITRSLNSGSLVLIIILCMRTPVFLAVPTTKFAIITISSGFDTAKIRLKLNSEIDSPTLSASIHLTQNKSINIQYG